ncbi:hypothetical protein [Verrucosispora sp. NA02020]|uniref:hypothetical protein n=1 Tax=Verrucosispora sp. NA02020 TaxID=2742132 RepID=UPI00159029E3|nr:hypothetical protein [Verrucosispora sp. NA02020]QKW15360.1 hypothetical protein HUT12_23080 [Verrucosispora sp. NA02020]
MIELAAIWHRLTHRHIALGEPDVGTIALCGHRLTGRICCATVDVDDKPSWRVRNPNAEQVTRLAAAPTAAELRRRVWAISLDIPKPPDGQIWHRPARRFGLAARYGLALGLVLAVVLAWWLW